LAILFPKGSSYTKGTKELKLNKKDGNTLMTSGIKEKNTGRLFFKIFLEKQK